MMKFERRNEFERKAISYCIRNNADKVNLFYFGDSGALVVLKRASSKDNSPQSWEPIWFDSMINLLPKKDKQHV